MTSPNAKFDTLALAQRNMHMAPHSALTQLSTVSHGGFALVVGSMKAMTMTLVAMPMSTAHIAHSHQRIARSDFLRLPTLSIWLPRSLPSREPSSR